MGKLIGPLVSVHRLVLFLSDMSVDNVCEMIKHTRYKYVTLNVHLREVDSSTTGVELDAPSLPPTQREWHCFQYCLFVCLFVCLSVCLSANTITPEPVEI